MNNLPENPFGPQPYYALSTAKTQQEREQAYLIEKGEATKARFGINPLEALYTELTDFCNSDHTAGVRDYSVGSHREGMNKTARVYCDLRSYLYSQYVSFSNVGKSWSLNLLAPQIVAIDTALATAWVESDFNKSLMLRRIEIALCQMRMIIQHFLQCRFLSIDRFMIVLSKINGLFAIIKQWRAFADQSHRLP